MAKTKKGTDIKVTDFDDKIKEDIVDEPEQPIPIPIKKKIIFNYIVFIINKLIKLIYTVYGVYIVWIVIHYTASHIYVKVCVPLSWYGIIMSPILTPTPHCQGLRWIIYNGGAQINNMWITVGSWLGVKLII
jgi:hypothetical protein